MGRYSEILMDHFQSPRNAGSMERADHIGLVGIPGQGPFMVMFLRVRDACVAESRFQTYPCGAAIASGSMLTTLIKGKPVAECLAITEAQLAEALGGVPPDKLHCPAIAVTALRNALRGRQACATPLTQAVGGEQT